MLNGKTIPEQFLPSHQNVSDAMQADFNHPKPKQSNQDNADQKQRRKKNIRKKTDHATNAPSPNDENKDSTRGDSCAPSSKTVTTKPKSHP
jgi:hypothetical protein